MPSEKELQNAIITWLECQGAYVVSVKSGKIMASYKGKVRVIHLAPKGTPDVHVCWNGRPLYIELKKDQATADHWHRVVERYKETGVCAKSNFDIIEQHQCHMKIIRAGGSVIVCGSQAELERDLSTLGFIPTPHSYGRSDRQEIVAVPGEETRRRKESGKKQGGQSSRRTGRQEARKIGDFQIEEGIAVAIKGKKGKLIPIPKN